MAAGRKVSSGKGTRGQPDDIPRPRPAGSGGFFRCLPDVRRLGARRPPIRPGNLVETLCKRPGKARGNPQAGSWLARSEVRGGNLTNGERFSYAADLSLGLADPRERILKAKQVRRQWLERYPEQAKEWFASLPPEDRAALEAPLE
jgi:hypothetical protein